ncbi:hypothetical protein CLV35_2432 [Motilibacter peucedani]|uniref:Uncharacterized protein n=1 Tax=Motilibacter peucedani TaxID=598650 RepID=A0A420XP36_9ACTN|nr:hypothetical protein [Motilibacter peucedani]RKS73936.1 hypothetical protein CLV35_2432 [Motilibacter peucedani]
MRRAVAAGAVLAAVGLGLPAATAAEAAPTAKQGLTVVKFDNRGTLKVHLDASAPGPVTVTLLAYQRLAPPSQWPQVLTAARTKTLQPGATATLHVTAPDCPQVDGIVGTAYPSRLDRAMLQKVLIPGAYTHVTASCTPES